MLSYIHAAALEDGLYHSNVVLPKGMGQKASLSVVLRVPYTFLLDWPRAHRVRLAGQQAAGGCLSPPVQCRDHKHKPPSLTLYVGPGTQTQVFRLVRQAHHWLCFLPRAALLSFSLVMESWSTCANFCFSVQEFAFLVSISLSAVGCLNERITSVPIHSVGHWSTLVMAGPSILLLLILKMGSYYDILSLWGE